MKLGLPNRRLTSFPKGVDSTNQRPLTDSPPDAIARDNQTVRRTSACGCNNNAVMQKRLFSSFLPSMSQDGDTVEFIIFRV